MNGMHLSIRVLIVFFFFFKSSGLDEAGSAPGETVTENPDPVSEAADELSMCRIPSSDAKRTQSCSHLFPSMINQEISGFFLYFTIIFMYLYLYKSLVLTYKYITSKMKSFLFQSLQQTMAFLLI